MENNSTFNLPDVSDCFIQGGNSGTKHSAGLPSIEHTHSGTIKTSNGWNGYYLAAGSSAAGNRAQSFSTATNSAVSSIYGNSATVQPKSVEMKYCIKY